jgi:glycosyltransferase involved in cell wall biosynthesis
MPNSLLEAMRSGLLCIVSNIPAYREAVKHMESGIILSDDVTQDIEVIKAALVDQARYGNIGMAAQLSLNERTWSRCAQKYLEVFDQI